MTRLYSLPGDCLSIIYAYDPTYRVMFSRILGQLLCVVENDYAEKYAQDFGYLGRYRCSFYDDVDLMSIGEPFVVSNYPDPDGDTDNAHDRYYRRASFTKTSRHPDIVALVRYRAFFEQCT